MHPLEALTLPGVHFSQFQPEAIATGKADAGIGMALRWVKALEQGFDVKLMAGTHGGCLRLLTAAIGNVKTLEDLKGKAICVTDMASPDRSFFPFW